MDIYFLFVLLLSLNTNVMTIIVYITAHKTAVEKMSREWPRIILLKKRTGQILKNHKSNNKAWYFLFMSKIFKVQNFHTIRRVCRLLAMMSKAMSIWSRVSDRSFVAFISKDKNRRLSIFLRLIVLSKYYKKLLVVNCKKFNCVWFI